MITNGWKINMNIDRPPHVLINRFKGIPSSNINDMQNRLFCMRGLHPMNKLPLLGPAFTVKVPEGDNLLVHCALDMISPGDILVIDAGGYNGRAILGEIMVTYLASLGCGGIIVDGAIRDRDGLANADIPVYARDVNPNGPYKNGPGEINMPISCGGQVVFPGDILVGDPDGIVVIRPDEASELAEISSKKKNAEDKEFEAHKNKTFDYSNHIKAYRDKILQDGIPVIK